MKKHRIIIGSVVAFFFSGLFLYLFVLPVSIEADPAFVQSKENNKADVSIKILNHFMSDLSFFIKPSLSIEPDDFAISAATASTNHYSIEFKKPGKGILRIRSFHVELILPLEFVQTDRLVPVRKDNAVKSSYRILYDTYKHMEMVYFRDGMIIKGVMFEKGDSINLITPDGTLSLSKADVFKVVYLKPENL